MVVVVLVVVVVVDVEKIVHAAIGRVPDSWAEVWKILYALPYLTALLNKFEKDTNRDEFLIFA